MPTRRKPTRREVLLALAAAALPVDAKIGGVQIGVCGGVSGFAKAAELGFDYYEPSVSALSILSEQDFEAFQRLVASSRIRCDSCNNFIRSLKVVGKEVNAYELKMYMSHTLDRVQRLGTRVVVWGSSASRNVPEGFSRDTAWSQIKTFLKYAGDIAQKRGIVIAIEPLRKQESNIINTGAEALQLVQEVGHPNVKMIIDYYHLHTEKEDPQILIDAKDQIVHLHFANPAGRVWPKDPAEDPGYGPFFEAVKQIHFSQGLSIEGRGTLEADAQASLAFFRKELEG